MKRWSWSKAVEALKSKFDEFGYEITDGDFEGFLDHKIKDKKKDIQNIEGAIEGFKAEKLTAQRKLEKLDLEIKGLNEKAVLLIKDGEGDDVKLLAKEISEKLKVRVHWDGVFKEAGRDIERFRNDLELAKQLLSSLNERLSLIKSAAQMKRASRYSRDDENLETFSDIEKSEPVEVPDENEVLESLKRKAKGEENE